MSGIEWIDICDIEKEEEIDEFEKELLEMEEERMKEMEKELVGEECIEGLDDIVVSPKLEVGEEINSPIIINKPIIKKRGRPKLNLTTKKVVLLEKKKRGRPTKKISIIETPIVETPVVESVKIIETPISIKEEVKVLENKNSLTTNLDQFFNHLHLLIDDIKNIIKSSTE